MCLYVCVCIGWTLGGPRTNSCITTVCESYCTVYVCALKVLSTSVANALEYYKDPRTEETELFIRKFDYFFDCLNVRSKREWITKKKQSLKPYTSPTDSRLSVSV